MNSGSRPLCRCLTAQLTSHTHASPRLQRRALVTACSLHQTAAGGAAQAKRNAPVDVQMGGELWEDAPQELRSRLWMALLDHTELVGTLTDELVCKGQNKLHKPY